MNKVEIKKTADGSHTLFVPDLNENYHSVHGAIEEAKHVFIKNGIAQLSTHTNILEVGFGTGLNAFLTLLHSMNHSHSVNYVGIEKHPVDTTILNELNYLDILDKKDLENYFLKLHNTTSKIQLTDEFNFEKKVDDFITSELEKDFYHLVYFDAFAPEKQPEMWTKEIFEKIYSSLSQNGFLVTYCAKGEFKRTLKSVGFRVEALPGPPMKREMVKAVKI